MYPTVEQITERLFRRTQATILQRYKVPYPEQDAAKMLYGFYCAEMQKRHCDTEPDKPTKQNIMKAAKWLTVSNKSGLLLYGTVGSGKTTLANAICSMIDTIHDSAFESERKFVRRITADKIAELSRKEGELDKYKTSEMLFIDDMGIEPTSVKSWGNELQPLIDILYYRYDRMLFTIITSNLDNKGIEEAYGLRVLDRINEMFDRLAYAGESYRK